MGILDLNKKNNCPLCGKNMDFIYGDMVCSDCGYRASYGASSATSKSSANTSSQQIPTPKISYAPPVSTPTVSRTSSTAKQKKSTSKVKPLILCIAIIYIIAVFGFNFTARKSITSITDNLTAELATLESNYNYDSDSYGEHSFPTVPDIGNDYELYLPDIYKDFSSYTKSNNYSSYPSENSEGVIKTAEALFGKDISDVTAEELASVEYLDFYYYDYSYKTVSCSLYTGTEYIEKEIFLGDVSFYGSDFSIFPNLTGLYMEYGDIASLEGLHQLSSLSTNMTPVEIMELIDPAQITSLTLNDLFFANDFSGIENFTNLASLSMDAYYVENLDILAELKNLKALTIWDANNTSSLKVLYKMPQLEYLNLDCEELRDIGFVSNMPNLTCLIVWNSELKNIDALADCKDSLTQLDLSYNYELTDYDVVSELTHLEELALYVPYSFENPVQIPQLSNMPNLTYLFLGNFEDLSGIVDAPGLTSLSLYDTYAYDLSALASLQNLTSLELYNMSLEPSALQPIMGLTKLEHLSLDGSYIWGNAEELLSLPNLKECYMEDCVAGFEVENLVQNDSLEVLNLNHAELRILENGNWNYNEDTNILSLSEHTDIFKNYPNLRQLYVAEHELDNVQFAASIPYLEVLDLTDNYVTDLTPMAILPNLESVLCYNNPIVNDGGLGSKVSME